MSDRRGRPHSPRTRAGAAAVSGKQRLAVGMIVNIAALVAWGTEALDRRCYSSQCPGDGGTSRAGLRSKKLTGLSLKPSFATGITGQSSARGMW